MILAQTIVDRCNFLLDSEGSDRYTWDQDFRYAIAMTNEYLVSVFNAAFAQNKLSEESLKELVYVKVWQTSLYSRFAFDSTDVGHSIWSILAIHPKITTYPASPSIPAATAESVYRDDVSFLTSAIPSCKRLTAEEWTNKGRNPFVAGSSLITCSDLQDYAYLNYADYTGGYTLTNNQFEIEIAPPIPGELIAMRYLKLPAAPTVIGGNIEFPSELTNLAVDLTMKFIGIKQGELSTYEVTTKEVNDLISLMS